jgi:glucose-1-phosphate thymidylyltransferase
MKTLLLAAGYSRRLEELTQDLPKSLLTVGGKTLLDLLMEKLEKVKQLDNELYLVTNAKYYQNFVDWKQTYKGRFDVKILNDKTTCNEERLGAIGDILLSIEHFNINEDLLISATDGYFEFGLEDYVNFFDQIDKDCVLAKRVPDREELKRLGVASIDENNIITLMEEKPQEPKSDIAVFATYLYKKETLPLFNVYKAEGNNMDAPGNFVSWLYKRKPVYAYVVNQEIVDIGTVDVYNKVVSEVTSR